MVHLILDLVEMELDETEEFHMADLLTAAVGLGKPCEILQLARHFLELFVQVGFAEVDATFLQLLPVHLHDLSDGILTGRTIQ